MQKKRLRAMGCGKKAVASRFADRSANIYQFKKGLTEEASCGLIIVLAPNWCKENKDQ